MTRRGHTATPAFWLRDNPELVAEVMAERARRAYQVAHAARQPLREDAA